MSNYLPASPAAVLLASLYSCVGQLCSRHPELLYSVTSDGCALARLFFDAFAALEFVRDEAIRQPVLVCVGLRFALRSCIVCLYILILCALVIYQDGLNSLRQAYRAALYSTDDTLKLAVELRAYLLYILHDGSEQCLRVRMRALFWLVDLYPFW